MVRLNSQADDFLAELDEGLSRREGDGEELEEFREHGAGWLQRAFWKARLDASEQRYWSNMRAKRSGRV